MISIKQILCEERRWTQGAHARDANNFQVHVDDVAAEKFCLTGAVMHNINSGSGTDYNHVIDQLCDAIIALYPDKAIPGTLPGALVTRFNDTANFQMIRAVIERAGV